MSSTENSRSAPLNRLDPYFEKADFEWDCEHRAPVAKLNIPVSADFVDALLQRLRLNKLERELEDLKRQFDALKSSLEKRNRTAAADPTADPCIADLLLVTAELFPGECQTEVIRDPDEPESPIVVFNVCYNGKGTALLEQRLAWHRRVAAIKPGSSGKIRISIVPHES